MFGRGVIASTTPLPIPKSPETTAISAQLSPSIPNHHHLIPLPFECGRIDVPSDRGIGKWSFGFCQNGVDHVRPCAVVPRAVSYLNHRLTRLTHGGDSSAGFTQ